jgi:hypothetical protein
LVGFWGDRDIPPLKFGVLIFFGPELLPTLQHHMLHANEPICAMQPSQHQPNMLPAIHFDHFKPLLFTLVTINPIQV